MHSYGLSLMHPDCVAGIQPKVRVMALKILLQAATLQTEW